MWSVILLLLNGVVFLQIRSSCRAWYGRSGHLSTRISLAAAVSIAVIVVRFAWVYPVDGCGA